MNPQELVKKLNGQIPQVVIDELPYIMDKYKINTGLRLAHFLAQCAHESGNFKVRTENLNYSAKRLTEVFRRYFPTMQMALQYQRNPQKIANLVYGNRMGNGNEASGDGWRFRGRGYIQLTGRNNYTAFEKSTGFKILENPDLVATTYPLASAAWFFHINNINAIADRGATRKVIEDVTLRVNGGRNGLEDRISKFYVFFNILK
jgi:putative chitinase